MTSFGHYFIDSEEKIHFHSFFFSPPLSIKIFDGWTFHSFSIPSTPLKCLRHLIFPSCSYFLLSNIFIIFLFTKFFIYFSPVSIFPPITEMQSSQAPLIAWPVSSQDLSFFLFLVTWLMSCKKISVTLLQMVRWQNRTTFFSLSLYKYHCIFFQKSENVHESTVNKKRARKKNRFSLRDQNYIEITIFV